MIHKLFTKNNGLYKIRKNMNFSGFWFFKVFFKPQKPFQVGVVMDKSCEVQTLGVQKIFGIGNLLHHKNSDRYGFIYEGNHKFGIYSYQYRDGKLIPWEKLGTVKTEEPFFIVFDNNSKFKIGRYLYPYFEQDGDDEEGAPHDMKIRLYFRPVDKSVHAQVFNL